MAIRYLHVDVMLQQSSKVAGYPCGDVMGQHRDDVGTTIVLSDGLGSGIKANIAATLCVSRALALLKAGVSMKETFAILVKTMNEAWGTDKPFAVFTLSRILSNGETIVLSYEMPPPILVNSWSGNVLKNSTTTIGKAICHESHCSLKNGEALLLVSDGITQAGLGCGLVNGWEIVGVAKFITSQLLKEHAMIRQIPGLIHSEARRLWQMAKGDDCTVTMAFCRNGITVNLMTGPPADRNQDTEMVRSFLSEGGIKIICGGSTAKMVARIKGTALHLKENTGNAISPPEYTIDGINCVMEGAITLNHVFNLLDEDLTGIENSSGVHAVTEFLNMADKINIWAGDAMNEDVDSLVFKQQHILRREVIMQLLAGKLREKGKLVVHRKWV